MINPTRSEITHLLNRVAKVSEIGKRIESISAQFLDRPYVTNSLGGGKGMPELLTIRLDGFDCVTFIETVLALALSQKASEFAANLQRIRYQNGEVGWQTRNHYMVDWWRSNESQGLLKNLTKGREAVVKSRLLNVVSGLPERRVSFRVFPKSFYPRLKKRIETGDLVCFASAKQNLDVFHTGVLIWQGDDLSVRHATRAVGKVIDQDLQEFLENHRMSGLILCRPCTK